MNISIAGKIIALWGVLVALGWALATMPLDYFGLKYTASALLLWSALMAIGLFATYKWFPAAMQNKVVKVWTVIIVGGMLLNFANFYKLLPSALAPYIYLHGWILLTAIGFVLTALWWTPKSKMVYAAGAVLNMLLLVALVMRLPGLQPYSLWLAALFAGGPIIADGLMNYALPSKPSGATPAASAPAQSSGGKKVVVKIVAKK